MANKSSGIGIGTIVFWGFLAYIFFGGDDNDTKKIEIIDQDKPAIVETIKESGKKIFAEGKIIIEAGSEKIKEELNKKTEATVIVSEPEAKPDPEEEKSEEMIAKQKPEKDELKTLNDNNTNIGMKKL